MRFLDKNYVYTRLELVDKDELLRPPDRLGITEDHPSFRIGAYTFGGVRDVWTTDKVQLGIGMILRFTRSPHYSTRSMVTIPSPGKCFSAFAPPGWT